jgi:hypothetical protein
MRFANYSYFGKNLNNLGDHVQILTIDYLYQQCMGISSQDIVYINKDNLEFYDGEPVLLPVSMPLIEYREHGIANMFSDKITPVFFGLTMAKDELLPEEVDYLKRYEPIGCRDERTYNILVNYGVSAYLNGCLTITLPMRKSCPTKQNKVFIIDPTRGIKNYIPDWLAKDAIWDTHLFSSYLENPTQTAKERYKQYSDEARLIITSLLHCSVPCMAMGIPVILGKDIVSYRFGWLEALLKIYTPSEYTMINWNPAPIEYEFHKELVKDLFFKRMYEQDFSLHIKKIHNFYMNRVRKEYIVDAFMTIQDFIDKTWLDFEKKYVYAVWGLTQMSTMTISYISKRYPNAKLMHAYDIRTGLKIYGISTLHPENIALYPDETVFVTTVSAADSAKKFFEKINKPTHMYNILEVIV